MLSAFAPNSSATSSIAILRRSNQRTTTDSAFYRLVTHFFTRLPCPGGILARDFERGDEAAIAGHFPLGVPLGAAEGDADPIDGEAALAAARGRPRKPAVAAGELLPLSW